MLFGEVELFMCYLERKVVNMLISNKYSFFYFCYSLNVGNVF